MELRTDRLILCSVCLKDVPVLVEYFTEPIWREQILWFQRDASFMRKLLTSVALGKLHSEKTGFHLAVSLEKSGELLGACFLQHIASGVSKLGWHFGQRHSGRGYASECTRELLRHCREIGRARVIAHCFPGNAAGQNVLKKCGFVLEKLTLFERVMLSVKYMQLKAIVSWIQSTQ